MVPPVYSMYGLVFQLDQTCDKHGIIRWLRNGLERTLGQCRQLVGTIKKNEFGDYSVVRTINSGARLDVQWLDEGDFVAYSELEGHNLSSCAFGDMESLCVDGM